MLSLACRDIGLADCEFVATGNTEEELWKKGSEHIVRIHGTEEADITPQFKQKYSRYIKHS